MTRPLFLTITALAAMSLPTHAIDCARASTDTEKLICSDAGLKAADDAMGVAWKRLGDLLDKDEMLPMRASQRAWLKMRDDRCGYGEAPERVQCLRQVTEERMLILSGEPRTGPGASSQLVPFAVHRPGSKKTYLVDIAGVRFADPQAPGERAFNKMVDDAIKASPLSETVDFESFGELTYSESTIVEYAAPHLISALSSVWRYDGGAHGNYYSTGHHFSPQDGELSYPMLFGEEAANELAAACRDGLARPDGGEALSAPERKEMLFEDTLAVFAEQVKNLGIWSFDAQGARVHFAPYAIASYAAGEFECRLPLDLLNRLSKAPQYLPR
jgi:uncharacterized protein YecT (DUF1311 family)